MAIGSVRGVMVSTTELCEEVGFGLFVNLDHEMYEVDCVTYRVDGSAVVRLIPQFGKPWDLEVASQDVNEPMWELEGQS